MQLRLVEQSARLHALLRSYSDLLVAYSGGVDSSVLLHAARAVLGERAVAVIADSPSLPRRELQAARELAASLDARLVEIQTLEGDDEAYRANTGDRCFHCKRTLFEEMERYARSAGYHTLAYGEIVDDLLDDRPGARAAKAFHVVAPLADAGFDKQLVRFYAATHGLDVADKPASACLASRIPVGTVVTRERLALVERAEDELHDLGLREVRVRHHGGLARIEVGRSEFDRALKQRTQIERVLFALGFERIDLGIYLSPAERGASLSER